MLALPYLHGLPAGDYVPALEQFLGSSARLSPATVTCLTQQWQTDHAAFLDRDLAEVDYVYMWADGIHLNVHLEEAKAYELVLVGVRADGSKELVALKDDHTAPGPLRTRSARRAPRARRRLSLSDGSASLLASRFHESPSCGRLRLSACWAGREPDRGGR
ncbi:transposase [Streptomyces sp. NPDC050564]|uniref:transposase n=1 Tax=Streptomyces sp. NPDC050564 TaxID=3365631 RepID=UPI0037B7C4B4